MNVKGKKTSHTTRFLIGSFTLLLLISAGAFLCLGYYMSSVSSNAINKVGNLYMAGINEQISAHFRTIINLNLEQVESAVTVVSNDADDIDELYEGKKESDSGG